MNHTFKIVFNHARGCMVAVNEISRTFKKKQAITVITLALAAAFSLDAGAAISTIEAQGTYNFTDTTAYDGKLIDLNTKNEATTTVVNLNTSTGLSISRQEVGELVSVQRNMLSGAPQTDPEGTTTINGKLNLHAEDNDFTSIDTRAIYLGAGHHTMTFSDDVKVSMTYSSSKLTETGRVDGVHCLVGTIEFKKNLTIQDVSMTVTGTSDGTPVVTGIRTANYSQQTSGSPNAAGNVIVGGDLSISNLSASGAGAHSYGLFSDGGTIALKSNVTIDSISATGDGSYASGIAVSESAVEIDKDLILSNVTAQEAYGLSAENGTITLNSNVTIDSISAMGDESYASGIEIHGGTVKIEKGFVLSEVFADEAYGLVAYAGGSITVNASQSSERVVIKNNMDVADANSTITANFMTSDSVFSGLTTTTYDTSGTAQINLLFANSATWKVPSTNTLPGTLTLNGGVVDLTSSSESVTLTVSKLAGSGGTFAMRMNQTSNITDQVVVKEGTGSHRIKLNSQGTEPTATSLEAGLAQVESGDATFTLEGESIDIGLYKYELDSRKDTDSTKFYLKQVESADTKPDSSDDDDSKTYSESAKAVLALSSLGAQTSQYLNSLSDLRKRLGDVRNNAAAGLWVSAAGQKDRFTGFEGMGFKQKSWRVNLGYDHAFGNWLIGANFKHADSSQKITTQTKADGDAHSEGINLYTTYIADNGLYADLVLSADKNYQKFSTRASDESPVNAKYNNWGYGASLEAGYQWVFNQNYALFVEPQIQLSYYKVKGEDFELSNGMKVSQEDFDSLTGRVGAVFGKTFKDQNGNSRGQVALHFGWKGELNGKNTIRVNETEFSERLMKNRFYYGLNYNMMFTDNLRCYGYVEREEGHGYTKEIEAGIGLKYAF